MGQHMSPPPEEPERAKSTYDDEQARTDDETGPITAGAPEADTIEQKLTPEEELAETEDTDSIEPPLESDAADVADQHRIAPVDDAEEYGRG